MAISANIFLFVTSFHYLFLLFFITIHAQTKDYPSETCRGFSSILPGILLGITLVIILLFFLEVSPRFALGIPPGAYSGISQKRSSGKKFL